jgi:hypothetical protein
MMRLTLDFADFGVNPEFDDAETINEKLEKKLEDEFCNWDIDMAFDWETLQYYNDHIEIGFAEFK